MSFSARRAEMERNAMAAEDALGAVGPNAARIRAGATEPRAGARSRFSGKAAGTPHRCRLSPNSLRIPVFYRPTVRHSGLRFPQHQPVDVTEFGAPAARVTWSYPETKGPFQGREGQA